MSSPEQRLTNPWVPPTAGHSPKGQPPMKSSALALPTSAKTTVVTPGIVLSRPPVLPLSRLTVEGETWTCGRSNRRAQSSPESWNPLRKPTARQTKLGRAICRGCGPQWSVTGLEVWHDDEAKHVQIWERGSVCCLACPAINPLGVAEPSELVTAARALFFQWNRWTETEANPSLAQVGKVREVRAQPPWTRALAWVRAGSREGFLTRAHGRKDVRRRHGKPKHGAGKPAARVEIRRGAERS